jgi:hypothetical protein
VAKYGRAAISGVRLEIDAVQAGIVRRVFEKYAKGDSLSTIAKALNAEGVLAPQSPRNHGTRGWFPSAIREMLRNERYRGVCVWNRTRKERNPETGQKISRARPESEWVRVEVPEWRIVDEDLWGRVERQIKTVNERFGNARCGGFSRTERSKQYLFSGFLSCGLCGSNIIIVSGGGLRGYVKYGCPSHRYRGVCSNNVLIRQDRMEEQLIQGLTQKVLQPELIDHLFQRFTEELQRRLKGMEQDSLQAATEVNGLRAKRDELKTKAKNLAEAVAAMGHSPSLLSQLSLVEAEIEKIDNRLAVTNKPQDVTVSIKELREFVARKAFDLTAVLRSDVPIARQALANHLQKLVLTPKETPDGQVLAVSGDVDLFGGDDRVVLMVARDGIEPPLGSENRQVIDSTLTQKAPNTTKAGFGGTYEVHEKTDVV